MSHPDTTPPPGADTAAGGRKNRNGGQADAEVKTTSDVERISALITAIVTRGYREETRLTYRRQGWQKRSTRVFQSEKGALRYAKRLQQKSDPNLAPLELLIVEQRAVPPWEHVIQIIPNEGGRS